MCPRSTQEKTNAILTYIAEKASYPRDQILIDEDSISPIFYCINVEEVKAYLKHLKDSNLVDFSGPRIEKNGTSCYRLELTVEGWQKVEEQAKPNIESKQAFVAMWFDDEMKSAYSEGIAKLEEDTGFSMLRIDMKQFNDKICDKILAEIRRSRFLIADVTKHRQGVYFEAGFAMGLGLPVIWTCRQDEIDECHFDTRQYNHITWNNENELRQKLRDRIIATIGKAS
ncbi:MAG: nucleoside 2-deoxyribosyltransferase [Candidatus Hodarchaeales archaeon]